LQRQTFGEWDLALLKIIHQLKHIEL